MENILAERTIALDVDGKPQRSIRMMIGKPVLVDEDEWSIPYEIHGPGADQIERRELYGFDAWQVLRLAFWFVPEQVINRVPMGSRLTFEGNENWSAERRVLPPP